MKSRKQIHAKIVMTVMLVLAVSFVSYGDPYPDVYASGFGPDVTGWTQTPDGTWRYQYGGSALTGWQTIGPSWYYFGEDGAMKTGWQEIGGKSYYLAEQTVEGHPKGSLYVSCTTPDGAAVNENGERMAKVNPYGHTCVEVDITNQMVYVYQGMDCVIASPCVTGTKGRRDTTPGDWAIRYKEKDTYLTGPTWRSHVDFWMPFHGGMGLHDANWRGTSHSNFGGQIYVTDGSHGCVNLPHDVAEQLYEIAFAGMPVHVHL